MRYTWEGEDGAVSRGFLGGAGGALEVMEEGVEKWIGGGGLLMARPCSGVSVPDDDDDGDIVIAGEKEEKEGGEKEEGEGDMGGGVGGWWLVVVVVVVVVKRKGWGGRIG